MDTHMIGAGARAAGMDTQIAARRFLAWLADDANPALTRIIQSWLWQPGSSGGLVTRPVSAWDVAQLRAEVLAAWPQTPGPRRLGAR